jgi:predicted Zn finger-like uncharacterized protein
MNVCCPDCSAVFRVDPRKVPSGGVRARCSVCAGIIRVPDPAAAPAMAGAAHGRTGHVPEPPAAPPARPTPAPEPPPSAPPPPAPPPPAPRFGAQDPAARARRLARALVSDIVVYHPDRRERGLREGTLRQEFRDEIKKSWEEYVAQVGEQAARSTPFFRDALNEILAGGTRVF